MLSVQGRPGKYRYIHHANTPRYTAHPNGYHAAVRLSEDYAIRARTELDIDDPSIDCLQALLLLEVAYTAAGKGKKAYMMLGRSNASKAQGNILTEVSERHWNGSCTRVTQGIRSQDQVSDSR
jgi:hypothetical protein